MNLRNVLVPLGGLALLLLAHRNWGWAGVAAATGGIVMFLLLHLSRTMTVLKRAADLPIGFVPSAVMLNAKLRPGVTLLHVVAMTRALGALRSAKDAQPEVYRWTDESGSWVDATFEGGKLKSWALTRPDVPPEPLPGDGAS